MTVEQQPKAKPADIRAFNDLIIQPQGYERCGRFLEDHTRQIKLFVLEYAKKLPVSRDLSDTSELERIYKNSKKEDEELDKKVQATLSSIAKSAKFPLDKAIFIRWWGATFAWELIMAKRLLPPDSVGTYFAALTVRRTLQYSLRLSDSQTIQDKNPFEIDRGWFGQFATSLIDSRPQGPNHDDLRNWSLEIRSNLRDFANNPPAAPQEP